jgi:RNA polymerase sigma-70 factor (ECF subfamily)
MNPDADRDERRRPLSDRQRRLYTTVFPRARGRLHALALRLAGDPDDAGDLVQETMLRAVQHADQLSAEGEVDPWLVLVLRRVFYDRARARRRTVPLTPELETVIPAPSREPEAPWQSLSTGSVLAASEALPSGLRQVFQLHAEGASHDHIAARLQVRKQTVSTRLHRARRRIQRVLRAAHSDASSLSSAA